MVNGKKKAQLVLDYLKEIGCHKSFLTFKSECKWLAEVSEDENPGLTSLDELIDSYAWILEQLEKMEDKSFQESEYTSHVLTRSRCRKREQLEQLVKGVKGSPEVKKINECDTDSAYSSQKNLNDSSFGTSTPSVVTTIKENSLCSDFSDFDNACDFTSRSKRRLITHDYKQETKLKYGFRKRERPPSKGVRYTFNDTPFVLPLKIKSGEISDEPNGGTKYDNFSLSTVKSEEPPEDLKNSPSDCEKESKHDYFLRSKVK